MNKCEKYQVQEKPNGANRTEWHFRYWLPARENLKDAKEDLKYARANAEHGEMYRIIHETRQWEYFR